MRARSERAAQWLEQPIFAKPTVRYHEYGGCVKELGQVADQANGLGKLGLKGDGLAPQANTSDIHRLKSYLPC